MPGWTATASTIHRMQYTLYLPPQTHIHNGCSSNKNYFTAKSMFKKYVYSVSASSGHQCTPNTPITLSSPSGYIISRSDIESEICTWRIEATPGKLRITHTRRSSNSNSIIDILISGQHINITMYDFGGLDMNYVQYCNEYATIREPPSTEETVVCAGMQRIRNIYVSKANVVDILFTTNHDLKRFILHYEGIVYRLNILLYKKCLIH